MFITKVNRPARSLIDRACDRALQIFCGLVFSAVVFQALRLSATFVERNETKNDSIVIVTKKGN